MGVLAAAASKSLIFVSLLLLLLPLSQIMGNGEDSGALQAVLANNGTMTEWELHPIPFDVHHRVFNVSNNRRNLAAFQICALCTCCGGHHKLCFPSPCCYSINCNIPNRPFGFCSFTPKACNCFGCHL